MTMTKAEYTYPAFFDGHLHFLGTGILASVVNLEKAKSREEISLRLKTAANKPEIIGRGWNQLDFEDGSLPDRTDLDKVASDRVVIAYRVCGHMAVVNGFTLEKIRDLTGGKQYPGGKIDYQNAILTENALGLLRSIMKVPDRETIKEYFIAANRMLLKSGVSTVMSDDFQTLPVPYPLLIDILNELYSTGELQVKIIEQVQLRTEAALEEYIANGYVHKDFGKWKLGPLKLLTDGSLGARTAKLRKPYQDKPDTSGILTYTDAELKGILDLANANNLDCHIHAIGDGAMKQVLDIMERSLGYTKRKDHRHAVIHAQLATRADIARMKQLGISAIVQPIFLETDIGMVAERIGDRSKEAYLFKTMHDAGLVVGFSTDSPVETYEPVKNLYAALARKSTRYPGAGIYLPEERFSISEALACYTKSNWYLAREENIDHSDRIVLDTDLFHALPEVIREAKILRTVINDRTVYESICEKEEC